MTNDDALDDIHDDVEPVATLEEPGSVLQQLRAEYAKASLDETEVFDIGPSPGLAIRCQYVPTERFDRGAKALRQIRDEGVQMTYASCDTLIAACKEILVYGPGGSLHPLTSLLDKPTDIAEPVTFDATLCEILGFPADTARSQRKIVIKLFKGNQQALRACAIAVSAWMESVGSKVREEFEGGSTGVGG